MDFINDDRGAAVRAPDGRNFTRAGTLLAPPDAAAAAGLRVGIVTDGMRNEAMGKRGG